MLATLHNNMGNLFKNLRKQDDAWAEYRTARDHQQKLVEQFPTIPDFRRDLARTELNLGNLAGTLDKRDDARAAFQAARDRLEKLVLQYPAVPQYQYLLGACYSKFGDLLSDEGKLTESLELLDLSIRTLKPIHDKEPRDPEIKDSLRTAYADRANAYDRLKKPTLAVKDWDKVVELSTPAAAPIWRARRAVSQLHSGMVAEAIAEIAELAKIKETPPPTLYNLACIYAVASGKIAEKKQEYADRAMELLHKAVKAGYKDAAHLKKDADLDPLRNRDDFRKLLAELEKNSPPPAAKP